MISETLATQGPGYQIFIGGTFIAHLPDNHNSNEIIKGQIETCRRFALDYFCIRVDSPVHEFKIRGKVATRVSPNATHFLNWESIN